MNGHILQRFFITFGFGQELQNCYTVVDAFSEDEARLKTNLTYGGLWAFIYRTPEEAGVHEFNLSFVEFGTPNSKL